MGHIPGTRRYNLHFSLTFQIPHASLCGIMSQQDTELSTPSSNPPVEEIDALTRAFNWIKAFFAGPGKPASAPLLSPLPWITFLVFPIAYIFIEFFVGFAGYLFDSPRIPGWYLWIGGLLISTYKLPPLVWLLCLVLYLRPVRGRRSIYCWAPLWAQAFHLACVVLLLVLTMVFANMLG